MTSLGRCSRSLQAGGAATDHHHRAAPSPRHRQRYRFPTSARICGAPQPTSQTHPPDAFLVAGQAGSHLYRLTSTRLVHKIRIGDLPANYAHQIAYTVLECSFGLLRRLETADSDDWKIDDLLIADGTKLA